MGLPLATEALDPNSPQYLGDLFQLVRYRRAYHGITNAPRNGLLACPMPVWL
ncbi:phospho-2-dehydro-3-deoxyheptonate aldolase [Klebsiella pneumoniae]|uniref:Phospho-2-dehydro-3-deoxyheptonate aldolase n=1 Tax=Klebsiella pneumoniae TaxID=573 RepID=A0A2X3F5Q2_KLEPN|nr:phospho-2-dehydro-3-deoxyheptonate aldolase [Klebsiella pneumoniae]